MIIVFLGPPGCGKGTQAQCLGSRFTQVSTGELLRLEMKSESPLGGQLKDLLGQGHLVDDSLVFQLLIQKLKELEGCNILLDGFPRRISQAKMLDEFLKTQDTHVSHVIAFEILENVLIERIKGRFSCKSCNEIYNDFYRSTRIAGVCDICGGKDFVRRSDDSVDIFKKRFVSYKEETETLKQYYSDRIKYIDASLSAEKLHNEILNILK